MASFLSFLGPYFSKISDFHVPAPCRDQILDQIFNAKLDGNGWGVVVECNISIMPKQ